MLGHGRPSEPTEFYQNRLAIAQIPALAPWLDRRALGTFESVPGGQRARCGGLGGGTVYAVNVAAPATLALHAVAQFPVALEVRDRSGGSRACARGEADPFEASLAATARGGDHDHAVYAAGDGGVMLQRTAESGWVREPTPTTRHIGDPRRRRRLRRTLVSWVGRRPAARVDVEFELGALGAAAARAEGELGG